MTLFFLCLQEEKDIFFWKPEIYPPEVTWKLTPGQICKDINNHGDLLPRYIFSFIPGGICGSSSYTEEQFCHHDHHDQDLMEVA